MMESKVLGQKSPLYGRRTGQYLVEPFGFFGFSEFFPHLSFIERVKIYSLTGGTPSYILEWDKNLSFWKNVKEKVFARGQLLYEEPMFLLREELREPYSYFSILRAIALGKTKLGEIINETGLGRSVVSKYLSVLSLLRIVKREIPITEKAPEKSKRGIYKIIDPFFHFWFRFVLPQKHLLEQEERDYVVRLSKKGFRSYLGLFYEEVCQMILRRFVKRGELPFFLEQIGRWWRRDVEIDIVGLNSEEKIALFGEVKCSNKPIGVSVLRALKQRSQTVSWNRMGRRNYFILFSLSGFKEGLIAESRKRKDLFLVSQDRLVG